MHYTRPVPGFTPRASELMSMDTRRIALMRFFLAAAALFTVYIDPSEPDRYVTVTYMMLALYVAYSAALLVYAWHGLSSGLRALLPWIDVGWYVVLTGLSSGTNSIFFFFFLFAILVTSFQQGFKAGLGLALVSAVLFSIVGLTTISSEPAFELNRFLLRPVALLGLGYLMAYWGGCELTLTRRLTLLKDVSLVANPRFGVDHTLDSLLEQLRTFYDAEACLLVTTTRTGSHSVRRVDRCSLADTMHEKPISDELTHLLLALPATQAAVTYGAPAAWAWWCREPRWYAYDTETGARQAVTAQIHDVLEAHSCLTVPWRQRQDMRGRLYITASRRRAFMTSDIPFLLQLLTQVMPIIENIELMDQLAVAAADIARERLAHDLHDGVIQPYVGLQMGLRAVCNKLAAKPYNVQVDLKQLLELTNLGIADLYRYTDRLKGNDMRGASILQTMQQFAAQFAQTTGLAVQVEGSIVSMVPERLAVEVSHMLREGLSNVRRHTCSTQATINLTCDDRQLSLRIANPVTAGAMPAPFVPRSIMERTVALGGRLQVERSVDHGTVIVVDIPL